MKIRVPELEPREHPGIYSMSFPWQPSIDGVTEGTSSFSSTSSMGTALPTPLIKEDMSAISAAGSSLFVDSTPVPGPAVDVSSFADAGTWDRRRREHILERSRNGLGTMVARPTTPIHVEPFAQP